MRTTHPTRENLPKKKKKKTQYEHVTGDAADDFPSITDTCDADDITDISALIGFGSRDFGEDDDSDETDDGDDSEEVSEVIAAMHE